MLYSEFQARLEQALADQDRLRPGREYVVRAIGQLAGARGIIALEDRTVPFSCITQPFVAIASSMEANLSDRQYVVALATRPGVSADREYFGFVGATASAHPRCPDFVTVQCNALLSREDHIAYIEGDPGTLTINGMPTLPDAMCVAQEKIDWE